LVLGSVNIEGKIIPARDFEPVQFPSLNIPVKDNETSKFSSLVIYESEPHITFYGIDSVVERGDIVEVRIGEKRCGVFIVIYDNYYGELVCFGGKEGNKISFTVNGFSADINGDVIFENGKTKKVEIVKKSHPKLEEPEGGVIFRAYFSSNNEELKIHHLRRFYYDKAKEFLDEVKKESGIGYDIPFSKEENFQ